MTVVAARRLEFTRGPQRDRLDSGRVVLDPNGPTYRILMLWRPIAESWVFDLRLTGGAAIVLGAAVRDRTPLLLGCSAPGRPAGDIMSYDPRGRADPVLESYATGGVGLYYFPAGVDPALLAKYATALA